MRNPRDISSWIVLGALLLVPATVSAQIMAPALERRALESGYAYKWFDRDVDGQALKWETASIYVRYAAFKRLTLCAEGGLWDIDQTDPEGSYSRWVVGGGATALLYTHDRWSLDAQFSYNEVYDHDESPHRTDKRTYGWNAGLLARGTFSIKGQRLDLYAGPMFVDDVAETFPFSVTEPVKSEPDQHWGMCAGAYASVVEYVSGFIYVLQVDSPQFRFGLSMRSRGERP